MRARPEDPPPARNAAEDVANNFKDDPQHDDRNQNAHKTASSAFVCGDGRALRFAHERLRSALGAPRRRIRIQRYVVNFGHALAKRVIRRAHAGGIIAVGEGIKRRVVHDLRGAGNGQLLFDALAQRYPVFPVAHRQQQQHAVVFFFIADAPGIEQLVGVFLGVHAVEEFHRHGDDLRSGSVVQRRAEREHFFSVRAVNDVRGIDDINVLCWRVRNRGEGLHRQRSAQQDGQNQKNLFHFSSLS